MNRDSLASVASLPQLSVKRGDDSAFQRISYKRDDETLKNVVFPKLIPGSQAGFSSMDSAWMVGFVEQDVHQLSTTEPQNEYQKRITGAKGKAPLGSQSNPIIIGDVTQANRGALTEDEMLRLEQLEQRLKNKKTQVKQQSKSKVALGMQRYATENKKLRAALKTKKPSKTKQKQKSPKKAQPAEATAVSILSSGLDSLFMRQRDEAEAAVKIQRAWRRLQRLRMWKKLNELGESAVQIQRIAKGFVTRKLIRIWLRRRLHLVTLAQACVRGVLGRIRYRRHKNEEYLAAVDIQRVWRSYAARKRCHRKKLKRAAISIQKAYRGMKARAEADRLWLENTVIKLQSFFRRSVSRLRFINNWVEESRAATRIQAAFRAYLARCHRNEELWSRETESRQMWIKILRQENLYFRQQHHMLERKKQKIQWDKRYREALQRWGEMMDLVHQSEFDLVNAENEHVKLSPRAIDQGWDKRLKEDMENHRRDVTELKKRALFEVALDMREARDRHEKNEAALSEMQYHVTTTEEQIEAEKQAIARRDELRNWARHSENMTKRVADQRRRWKVKFYTDSGKPDLRFQEGEYDEETHVESKLNEPSLIPLGEVDMLALAETQYPMDADDMMRGRDAELKAKHKAAMHIKQEEGRYQSRPSTANGWDDGTFGRPPRSPLLVSHRSRRSSGASEGRPIVENDLRVESAGSTRQRPGALASEHAAKSAGRVSETLQQLKLREGFVGETSIVSSKAERKNEYDDEMKQINNLGARVDFLSRKLHATNANMQYVQYGALLKPVMDSVDEMFDQISKNNVDSQTRNVTVELDERIKEEMRLGTFSYLNRHTKEEIEHLEQLALQQKAQQAEGQTTAASALEGGAAALSAPSLQPGQAGASGTTVRASAAPVPAGSAPRSYDIWGDARDSQPPSLTKTKPKTKTTQKRKSMQRQGRDKQSSTISASMQSMFGERRAGEAPLPKLPPLQQGVRRKLEVHHLGLSMEEEDRSLYWESMLKPEARKAVEESRNGLEVRLRKLREQRAAEELAAYKAEAAAKAKRLRNKAVVPWHLLDELEAEKAQMEADMKRTMAFLGR